MAKNEHAGKVIKMEGLGELPVTAISFGTMEWNETGSWRYLRPTYRVKSAPCILGCPAGEDIPRYLHKMAGGDLEGAWGMLIKDNPFPAVCGRLCSHPCEGVCLRGGFDEVVGVRDTERSLGDMALDRWEMRKTGVARDERVAVIGGGPTGLSCAYHLARSGYRVTVFDDRGELGGSLRSDVPEFLLPSRVLDGEIGRVLGLGVDVQPRAGTTGGKELEELLEDFSVLFIATGVLGDRPGPGVEDNGIMSGIDHIDGRKIIGWTRSGSDHDDLGRSVAVVGDGALALRSAMAVRRYADDTHLFLNGRTEDIGYEVEVCSAGGVTVHQDVGLKGVKEEGGGLVLTYEIKSAGEAEIKVDSLVLASAGSPVDSPLKEFMVMEDGRIMVDEYCRTSREDVFAGGGAVTGCDMGVAEAIAWGRRGARAIDAHLRGRKLEGFCKEREVVSAENLNLDHFVHAERNRPQVEDFNGSGTIEPFRTLGEETAVAEAARCFNCGICIFCDNCLIFCPDVAIKRAARGYTIDYYHCKGCGICVNECPRDAMSLESELKWKK
jgi:NADPH-dependent glutamate synthase beta subunit-like oxidoreductase/Pyruvate/2-oxoacid:ferredoxin oxidoreductase delta subunit